MKSLRVLMAPDKFKGTLTAAQAAAAMARGWSARRPGDVVSTLPISDGGDGFGEMFSALLGAELRTVKTVDAAHRPLEAAWWWEPSSHTAVIESARVIGLALLPRGLYHPFELDTRGLGVVLRAAAAAGARQCLLGIGGSATNDGGFGLACALGWQFFNHHEEAISRWTELHNLDVVRPPAEPLSLGDLTVAVDVRNPLLGPEGCSRVYGPQKGLKEGEFEFAERCLARLADVAGWGLAARPGAGAAGGLGFGLQAFAGARLEAGFGLFARAAGLAARLREVDLVVTGEGAIDASTLMGKGVGELAAACAQARVPCVGLAGVVPDMDRARTCFAAVHAIVPELATSADALAEPARWLERLSERAAEAWPG